MKHLSDQQLLGELQALKHRESKTTLSILRYLDEVERRKLHLILGYASLFAFATQYLRYSESAAGRRIQAARCMRRHPELTELLERDEVNLSTIATVSRVLSDANKKELLAQICNKSQRAVEAIVVAALPATRIRDRVKVVSVPVAEPAGARRGDGESSQAVVVNCAPLFQAPDDRKLGEAQSPAPKTAPVRDGTNHSRSGSAPIDSCEAACVEPRFMVQFAAPSAFMRKFDEARELLSGRFPKGAPFAEVFEAALDALLDKKSPTRRKARRERRAGLAKNRSDVKDAVTPNDSPARRPGTGRHLGGREIERERPQRRGRTGIPIAVRDAVFERDGRCTFVGLDGKRCDSTHDLEIDHEQPVARGGTSAIDNLRVLCARHNLLEAERVYGARWMQRFYR